MNHVNDSFQVDHQTQQTRQAAERWLAAFETALAARDAGRIGALFHEDCHWRDILAFTWDLSAARGRDTIASGLATNQADARAHAFHLPPGRKAPRLVRRLGRDCVEAIFEFRTAVGRGAGIVRLSPADGVDGESGEAKAWHLSTTLEELDGWAEKIGDNRPTGYAYSRNFGGDNWTDVRRKAQAYEDREPTVLVIGGALHPRFLPDGSSRFIRNGVGVRADGMVVLAISRDPVSLGLFARAFRDGFGCPDALFLDGGISAFAAKGEMVIGGKEPAGPILAVFGPQGG